MNRYTKTRKYVPSSGFGAYLKRLRVFNIKVIDNDNK